MVTEISSRLSIRKHFSFHASMATFKVFPTILNSARKFQKPLGVVRCINLKAVFFSLQSFNLANSITMINEDTISFRFYYRRQAIVREFLHNSKKYEQNE